MLAVRRGTWSATKPFLVSSRNAPGGALRDDTKNGRVVDYAGLELGVSELQI